jgi:integrase
MGSVRKRGDGWRAEVRRQGVYRSKEFRTKQGALTWVVETETDIGKSKARANADVQTLGKALDRYAEDCSPGKRGFRWEAIRLVKLYRDLGAAAHKPISEIAPSDIAEWRDKRLTQVSAASVNREWNLLRSVFSIARREWGWVQDNPMRDVTRPVATKARSRRVNVQDLEAIYRAAGFADVGSSPPIGPRIHAHRVVLAFELAIETGMRAGEIRTLEPEQIDLDRGICTLLMTKNGDSRDVPLSMRARELLRLLQRPEGPLLPMSAGVMDATFRKLKRKAGITDLHFHDSRAEAATRLSKKVDVLTLARILGHRDIKSLMTYYRESAEDIAARLG